MLPETFGIRKEGFSKWRLAGFEENILMDLGRFSPKDSMQMNTSPKICNQLIRPMGKISIIPFESRQLHLINGKMHALEIP